MSDVSFAPARPLPVARLVAILSGPAVAVFLSSNLVNAGNLAFNMLFSRWMGPALFADLACLLTIKLAVLNLTGALQMAVSREVAAATPAKRPMISALVHRAAWRWLVAGIVLLPFVLWAAVALSDFGLSSRWAPAVLAIALPFAVPLSLVRGDAAGRLDIGAMTRTAQVEMGVRLAGGIFAWQAGLGLDGVILAITASIIAGWAVVAILPERLPLAATRIDGRALAAVALPLAALQLAQVVLLDGDVLMARALFDAETAGFAAALGLIQRIQVFACIGLAAVVMPQVAAAVSSGTPALPVLRGPLLLAGSVTALIVTVAALMPEHLVGMLSGEGFLAAAPLALPVALTGAAFTLSYLAATFQAAAGDRTGLWLMLGAVPVQVAVLWAATALGEPGDLSVLIMAKLACQVLLSLVVVAAAVRTARRIQPTDPASELTTA